MTAPVLPPVPTSAEARARRLPAPSDEQAWADPQTVQDIAQWSDPLDRFDRERIERGSETAWRVAAERPVRWS